jgi:hypothetical protein
VALDGWQLQVLGNVGVADGESLVERASLEPLGGEGTRRYGRTATKCLELGVNDCVVMDLDLELHDVAAGGSAHQTSSDVGAGLVEGAEVARVGKVV